MVIDHGFGRVVCVGGVSVGVLGLGGVGGWVVQWVRVGALGDGPLSSLAMSIYYIFVSKMVFVFFFFVEMLFLLMYVHFCPFFCKGDE